MIRKESDRYVLRKVVQQKSGHLALQSRYQNFLATLLSCVSAYTVQAAQVHIQSNHQRVSIHMAVRLWEPVILRFPPGTEGGLGNAGAVVRLPHDSTLERAGIVAGEQAGRDAQPGVCQAVVHIAFFPVSLRGCCSGQDFINGRIAFARQNEGLRYVQPLTEYRGQVVEMGQLIVHKKAGTVFTDVLDHIGRISPVAETGAASGVHQVSVPGAKGKGRKENGLVLEAFHLV